MRQLSVDDDAHTVAETLYKTENMGTEDNGLALGTQLLQVIGNGAGLTLTAMDMIKLNGGEPATFLDIGGGASEHIINQALNIVLNYDPVKVVFLNVLGGITKADDVARGVIKALEQADRKVHIVIRLTGTNEEEGQRLLEEAGIPFETSIDNPLGTQDVKVESMCRVVNKKFDALFKKARELDEEDKQIAEIIKDKKVIVLLNKSDLEENIILTKENLTDNIFSAINIDGENTRVIQT